MYAGHVHSRDSMNDERLTAVLSFATSERCILELSKESLFLNFKGQSCYPMISDDFVVDLIRHIDRDCTLIETCDEDRSRCFID